LCFLRLVICVWGGRRDYSPPAPKNLATPLPRRLYVGVEIPRTVPLILKLGTRRRCVDSLASQALYPRRKGPPYHLNWGQ